MSGPYKARKSAAIHCGKQHFLFCGLLQHRTQICAGDQPCIACQPAGLDVRLRLDVGGLAGGKLLLADGQVDGRIRDVDLDGVHFLDKGLT